MDVQSANAAISSIGNLVKADGGDLEVVDTNDTEMVISVRYDLDDTCETCVLEPEGLEGMVTDILRRRFDERLRIEMIGPQG